MWKYLLALVLVCWGAFSWWNTRALEHGPGVLVSEIPVQKEIYQVQPFNYKGYQITPLASLRVQARVLARENYRFGREADLSPVDFALGWKHMSDEAVLDKISISQSNRFYYWRIKELPIPRREIETSSANMHMIPADDLIARKLESVRTGQLISFRGYLIRVQAHDGWQWVSSLTREDTGNGACELVWVTELTTL